MGLSDLIAGGMDATAATELLLNVIWTIVGATLVYFMQAGFAMVETGFTRAKNAGNIIMKNLMDFCIGTPVFWLVGFGIMFGAGNGFFGKIGGIASEANYGNAMLPDGDSVLLLLPSCPVPWQSVLNSSPTVSTVY